jgi:hypothetical protein
MTRSRRPRLLLLTSIVACAALVATGCGEKKVAPPAAPPEPAQATTPAEPVAVTATDATAPAPEEPKPTEPPPAPEEPKPAAALSPNTAILLTEAGLVAVDLADGAVKPLAAGVKAGGCVVDPKAGVVWLASGPSEAGEKDGSLQAFDLEGAGPPVVVASKLVEFDDLAIVYGEDQLGGGDPVTFSIGLEVKMGAAPTLAAMVGCSGDGSWFCYEDPGADEPVLIDELKARKAALDALKPADPALLARWAERGAARALRAPRTPEAKQPTERVAAVPKDGCADDPEVCGAAHVVDGTPFWRVVTSNDRGDFYYQTEQLYDPRDKTFFDLVKPTERRPAPLAEPTGIEGVRIAPSGAGYLTTVADAEGNDAAIVGTFAGKIVHRAPGATVCGWVGGGWRIPGPRGG